MAARAGVGDAPDFDEGGDGAAAELEAEAGAGAHDDGLAGQEQRAGGAEVEHLHRHGRRQERKFSRLDREPGGSATIVHEGDVLAVR